MERKLALLPQKERMIGSRQLNTERRLSVPALPIEPPQGFRKGFYECLNFSPNPFHRRGTEISQGYDVYQLRKASVRSRHSQNEKGLGTSPSAKSLASVRKSPSKVTFARDQSQSELKPVQDETTETEQEPETRGRF